MSSSNDRFLASRALAPLLLTALLGACGAPFTMQVEAIEGSSASSGAQGGAGGSGVADAATATATGSGSGSGGATSSGVTSGAGGVGGASEPPPECAGADLQSDGKNCGICAHDCFGAACSAGLCVPTTIASGQGSAVALTLDDTHVYWTDELGGAVMTALKSGGMLAVIAAGQTSPHRIATYGSALFWSNATPGQLGTWRASTTGSGKAQITNDPTPRGIAADATGIFWVVQANPQATLLHAKIDGSSVSILTSQPAFAEEIALDAAHVYMTGPTAGVVTVVNKNGTGLTSLVTSGKPLGLAVDATHVYWTDADAGTIARVDKASGSIEVLATGQARPTRIAVDADSVYWTNEGDQACVAVTGSVMKQAKSGGPAMVVAEKQRCARGIAVDGQYAYWTSRGAAAIQRVAK